MKKTNFFSSRAFRKGSLSLIFTVIMIVAVILLNIVVTAVSDKYPFSLDLTADKDYTITLEGEYKTFVDGISQDVQIYVCAPEDDFENSGYANQIVNGLGYIAEDTSVISKYALQVKLFVKTFPTMNEHIQVSFVDLNSPTEASEVTKKFAGETLQYGDIVVSCNHTATDGGTYERHQIIPMSDIFTLEEDQELQYYYGYYGYITGSSLASNVVSALYIATRSSSVEVALMTDASLEDYSTTNEYMSALEASNLKSFLQKNNYHFTEVDDLTDKSITDETQFLIIISPQNDFTADEIEQLQKFLENDGKYGRTLVYMPSIYQSELPKLEEFMAEWGIEILPALVGDNENYNYYYNDAYFINAQAADSEYTSDIGDEEFASSYYRAMRTGFESKNGYVTTKLLTSGENAYGLPLNQEELPEDWQPADSEYQGQFDLAIKSTYQYAESSTSAVLESNVIALSGSPFFSLDVQQSEILSSAGYYNATFTLNLFNGLSGQDESVTVQIQDKVINTKSFLTEIQDKNTGKVVTIIFMVVVPVALMALSLTIWIKRKRK